MPLMNSFYGGRQGASFIIVKNYIDVLTMVTDFSQGNDFTEVKFDEYVLINNPRKNHPDNGKIFRRGYDYDSNRTLSSVTLLYKKQITGNEEESWVRYEPNELNEEVYKEYSPQNNKFETESIQAYGAEYVGCIIGPAGKAPLLTIGAYDEVKQLGDSVFEERRSKGNYSPTNDTQLIKQGQNSTQDWREGPELSNNTISLIPGKYIENNEEKYNDSIQWCCVAFRNDNYGDDTEAFIGFKFPYLVTEMQTSQIEPYDNNGNIADMSNIYRNDGGSHPYYNKWHLNIPKGVKGDTFKNLRVTTYSNFIRDSNIPNTNYDRNLYNYNTNSILLGEQDDLKFFAQKYPKLTESEEEKILILDTNLETNEEEYNYITGKTRNDLINALSDKEILVYEEWNYDEKQSGQVKYYYLGDYNQIEDVVLDNDGYITVSFTNQEDKVLEHKLKWIKDIKLFAGHWEEEYQNVIDEEGHLVYLDSEDHQVYYPYPDDTVYKELDENDNPVPAQRLIGRYWRNITDTSEVTEEDNSILDQIQNGSLVVHYNDKEEDKIFNIPWVDKIRFDKEQGVLYYGITSQEKAEIPIGDHLYSIYDIIQTDNQLKIVYNHTDRNGEKYTQSFPLKSVSKIVLLRNPSTEENTDTEGESTEAEEENTSTEEVNNVFPIFARETPAQGETRGKIKYTENHEPIYESFVPNDEGLYQTTDPDDENTKKETLTGIVVFYTDGDHELITGQRVYDATIIQDNNQTTGKITEEIGGGFDYLEKFGFETAKTPIHGVENVSNAIYYKTLSDKNITEVPLTYPVAMYYDQNTGLIKYANSQNQEVDVGNLPIVESIDIGDDLDVYVKMSHPANYFQNIDPSHKNHDQKHQYNPSAQDYWYKIGNLIQKGLTFAGVRRVFLYSELKELVMALGSESSVYSLWQEWYQGKKIGVDDIITTLNVLYPNGNHENISTVEEEQEENINPEEGGTDEGGTEENEENTNPEEGGTEEEENENESLNTNTDTNNFSVQNSAFVFIAVKQNTTATSDFYAFSYDISREEGQRSYGTWFYVGSVGDLGSPDSIFRISEINSNNTEEGSEEPGTLSNPAILFRTPKDIYEIIAPQDSSEIVLSNPMKEIKEGATYSTIIKTKTALADNQIIRVTMNGEIKKDITSSNSTPPYRVSLVATGPITITKIIN